MVLFGLPVDELANVMLRLLKGNGRVRRLLKRSYNPKRAVRYGSAASARKFVLRAFD
ncbi:hypothetical protein [Paraburkholderia sp. J8-2]|uniref:hypothetical protein n=1 Tax=Paraburkholderia sp. J8-2 TaxID=2805440 RepID=UPI002AB6236C|nr:hypothetical protein [Paraburkholderia sp. J8-2]